MVSPEDLFLFSSEQECLTTLAGAGDPAAASEAGLKFLQVLATLAPSAAANPGIFNAYGRVYLDCGHVELAMMECDTPQVLLQAIEAQFQLAQQAAAQLAAQGVPLRLANNNHSGLLTRTAPIWGAHENYLVERHPTELGDLMLPFLATRFYAGSGGVQHPTGNYLAGVRHQFMQVDRGGGTTEERAIHSTARNEHHVGESAQWRRYHLILADGHRSHFNWALQFGATALAIKAVIYDRRLPEQLARVCPEPPSKSWVATLRRFNRLASPDERPRLDAQLIHIQQAYLDAARRYVSNSEAPPAWAAPLLDDWQAVLDAAARHDLDWLAARLDTFAKYRLFTEYLASQGHSWRHLPSHPQLFYELTLLDHSYHDIGRADSLFRQLEQAGVLDHRVCPITKPGEEPEPYTPQTTTRARARAAFIRGHGRHRGISMDWCWVHDRRADRWLGLFDPFAQDYQEWRPPQSPQTRRRSGSDDAMVSSMVEMLERVRRSGSGSDATPF